MRSRSERRIRFFWEWMLAMAPSAGAEQDLARRGAPYYSGLERDGRSLRRGAATPGATGRRAHRTQHRDLLDRHRALADRRPRARRRGREVLRDARGGAE